MDNHPQQPSPIKRKSKNDEMPCYTHSSDCSVRPDGSNIRDLLQLGALPSHTQSISKINCHKLLGRKLHKSGLAYSLVVVFPCAVSCIQMTLVYAGHSIVVPAEYMKPRDSDLASCLIHSIIVDAPS